tara:strand:- start:2133 stop:3008 length:876 start_codon:yes stop_codon:yes gene_type:complete
MKFRLLFIIGGLSIIVSWILFFSQKKQHEQEILLKTQFIEESNRLRDDLDDLIDEHDFLRDEYGDLNDELEQKDSLIDEYSQEIKRLLKTEGQLVEAKNKIEKLRQISIKYVRQVDSLLLLNTKLIIENDSVKEINKKINKENNKLLIHNAQLMDKMSEASLLKLDTAIVTGIRYTESGREKISKKARNILRLIIEYTIHENKFTDPGGYVLYVQIINPNNENIFNFQQNYELECDNQKFICAQTDTINYANNIHEGAMIWTRGDILISGKYTFNFFIDCNFIGSTTAIYK